MPKPKEKINFLNNWVAALEEHNFDPYAAVESFKGTGNYSDEFLKEMNPAMLALSSYLGDSESSINEKAMNAFSVLLIENKKSADPDYSIDLSNEAEKKSLQREVAQNSFYKIMKSIPEKDAVWFMIQYAANYSPEMEERANTFAKAYLYNLSGEKEKIIDGGMSFIPSLFAPKTTGKGAPEINQPEAGVLEFINGTQKEIDSVIVDVPKGLNDDIVMLANFGNFIDDDTMSAAFEEQRKRPGSSLHGIDGAIGAKNNFFSCLLGGDRRINMQYPRAIIPNARRETIKQIESFTDGDKNGLRKALTSAFRNCLKQCQATNEISNYGFSFPSQLLGKCLEQMEKPEFADLFTVTEKDKELAKVMVKTHELVATAPNSYMNILERNKKNITNSKLEKPMEKDKEAQDKILDVLASSYYTTSIERNIRSERNTSEYSFELFIAEQENDLQKHIKVSDKINRELEVRELSEFEKMNAENPEAFFTALKKYIKTTDQWKAACSKPLNEVLGDIKTTVGLDKILQESFNSVRHEKYFMQKFTEFFREKVTQMKSDPEKQNPVRIDNCEKLLEAFDALDEQRSKLPADFNANDLLDLVPAYENISKKIEAFAPELEPKFNIMMNPFHKYLSSLSEHTLGIQNNVKLNKTVEDIKALYEKELVKKQPKLSHAEKLFNEKKNMCMEDLKSNIEYAQFKLDAAIRSSENGKLDQKSAQKNIRHCLSSIIINTIIADKVRSLKGKYAEDEMNILTDENTIKKHQKELEKTEAFKNVAKSLTSADLGKLAMGRDPDGKPIFRSEKVNQLYRKTLDEFANSQAKQVQQQKQKNNKAAQLA